MKILVVGDLHGQKPKIHFKDFDAIIAIGDVCSDKRFRPIKNKWFKYIEKNKDNLSLDKFMIEKLGKSKIKQLEKESLKRGREILRFLCSFKKPVFFIPGNWDQSYGPTKIKDMEKSHYNYHKAFLDFYLGDKINPKLVKGLKNIVNCQYKLIKFNGFNIIGYGLSSNNEDYSLHSKLSIFNSKEKKKLNRSYKKLTKKLYGAYKKKDKNLSTIFLTHNVPYKTKLDVLKDKKSKYHGKHFGSNVARDFIKKHKPLLCIGGHMHEHFGRDKIGKTVCINAGFGSYVNTLIDLDEEKGKIRNIKFHPKTYG